MDLVGDLLGDRPRRHQAAGARGLGGDEAPVRRALHDRKSHVRPAVGDAFPVGEDSAGGLDAALDHVARQAAAGQFVQVVRLPAELGNQRAERERAVDTATGDHDVGALPQCLGDRKRPEVGIGADELERQLAPGLQVPAAHRSQRFDFARDVVADDNRHLERYSQLFQPHFERIAAADRVHASRVRDHLDPLAGDFDGERAHHALDEVGRVSELGAPLPRP